MSSKTDLIAPPISPAPGWEPVRPFPSKPSPHSFVSGAEAGRRTRVAYFRAPGSDHLHAWVWFGPGSEGPPESVHGGAIAAVLDEAMGAVCSSNTRTVNPLSMITVRTGARARVAAGVVTGSL